MSRRYPQSDPYRSSAPSLGAAPPPPPQRPQGHGGYYNRSPRGSAGELGYYPSAAPPSGPYSNASSRARPIVVSRGGHPSQGHHRDHSPSGYGSYGSPPTADSSYESPMPGVRYGSGRGNMSEYGQPAVPGRRRSSSINSGPPLSAYSEAPRRARSVHHHGSDPYYGSSPHDHAPSNRPVIHQAHAPPTMRGGLAPHAHPSHGSHDGSYTEIYDDQRPSIHRDHSPGPYGHPGGGTAGSLVPHSSSALTRGHARRPSSDAGDEMWTRISKDVLSLRAVRQLGYPFEETSDHITVKTQLKREQVDELLDLSEALRQSSVSGHGGIVGSMPSLAPSSSIGHSDRRRSGEYGRRGGSPYYAPSGYGSSAGYSQLSSGPAHRSGGLQGTGLIEDPNNPGTYLNYTRGSGPSLRQYGGNSGPYYQ